MKTVIATALSLAFLTSAALACPHMEEQKQTEKKDSKGDTTKQAQAKPAPKTPAPAPAPTKPAAPKTSETAPKT
ncbi:MAG: hypothetical protein IPH44_16965 [Myxococcales bacterium]|jgi:hypothetical protein|nr:hypothetical protein [Myxococcales bacterium]MBK7196548.1 hypothetical protein [Myxococcales bacterium]MBP6849724.1 hypothetical protein [Kofleriaceae bacterium]